MLLKRKKPGYEESKIKKTLTGIIYPVAFGVLIFILWQTEALHRLVNTTEAILPTPSHIGRIIVDNFPILWGNLVATLMPTLIGLFLGSVLGYGIAVLAASFKKWGKGGLTIVSCFNAVPIVALAPVFNNLVKNFVSDIETRGLIAKMLVITVMCMSSMSLNAYRGLTEIQPFGEDLFAERLGLPVGLPEKGVEGCVGQIARRMLEKFAHPFRSCLGGLVIGGVFLP